MRSKSVGGEAEGGAQEAVLGPGRQIVEDGLAAERGERSGHTAHRPDSRLSGLRHPELALVPDVLHARQQPGVRVPRPAVTTDRAQLRVPDQGVDAAAHGVRGDHAVGVGEQQDVPVRAFAAPDERRLLAGVRVQPDQRERKPPREVLQQLSRTVVGGVVHDDDVEVRVVGGGHRADAVLDAGALVADGQQEAHPRPVREAGEGVQVRRPGPQRTYRRVVVAAVGEIQQPDGAGQHGQAVQHRQAEAVGQAARPQAQEKQQGQQGDDGQQALDVPAHRRVQAVQTVGQKPGGGARRGRGPGQRGGHAGTARREGRRCLVSSSRGTSSSQDRSCTGCVVCRITRSQLLSWGASVCRNSCPPSTTDGTKGSL